jgi:PAT family beta-lactamase induction signal transducer AmpG
MGDMAKRSWGEALLVYRHPRVLGMLFLGFSAGLPFLLIFSTLSTWLRESDISLTSIGFFSWVGIMFSIKVVWAPVIDRVSLPLLTGLLGRRRGWLLLAQVVIAAMLALIAISDPASDLVVIAAMAVMLAFAAATQDVVIDAYRIEAVARDLQGAMAATYQLGYRMAMLVAGAGALYIAQFVSWPAAYAAMAACMSVGLITTLIIREPEVTVDAATRQREERLSRKLTEGAHLAGRWQRLAAWFSSAVVSPFQDFFLRMGRFGLVILACIALYRLSDIVMGVMAYPFYIDLGFSKDEIASVAKVYGIFMGILGAFLGGLLVARYGLLRPLLLGAVLLASTNLSFAYLAASGPDIWLLALTISADNLAGGLGGCVFIAYMSSLTNTAYTATQYALFSSLFTLPGKIMGGFSGMIVDASSYVDFFIYAAALGIPAIFLVMVLMWHAERRARADLAPAPSEE